MKKIVLSVALFSVLVVFTGCDVVFNTNSNNNISVDVETKVDIDTNSLTTNEPVVTEPVVTEPVVTEPVVTEPVDDSNRDFFSKLTSLAENLLVMFFLISVFAVLYRLADIIYKL